MNLERNVTRLHIFVDTLKGARVAVRKDSVLALMKNDFEPVVYYKTNKWVFVVNEKGFVKTCFTLNLTNANMYRYK